MTSRSRLLWLLWIGALTLFIANWLFPLSIRITRGLGVFLFLVVWFGLIALCWKRRMGRILLLTVTLLACAFLAWPRSVNPPVEEMRADYVAGLRRYDGVLYSWGGESPKGIDCSGLVRRGLIDAMFLRGVRTADANLVRGSLTLWWNDTTANTLGKHQDGLTTLLLETPSINALDHSKVLPGDLAVTSNGVHIMAYLGNQQWIEADPLAGRVITVSVPAENNAWFTAPMKIVRWSVLSERQATGPDTPNAPNGTN